LVTAL
jgi:membrane protease YdiL (CAAX protease family)